MLTQADFIEAAKELEVEVATIKAVVEVESGGTGFWNNGELVILFEPHKFYAALEKKGKKPDKLLEGDPSLKDILYKTWKTFPYPKPSLRWAQIQKASTIDVEAAYDSASYGLFQILGQNAKSLGYKNSIEMVQEFKKGEPEQLKGFIRFVKANKLSKYLKNKDFAGFALRYNGKLYKVNKYDEKLQKAYEKYSK